MDYFEMPQESDLREKVKDLQSRVSELERLVAELLDAAGGNP